MPPRTLEHATLALAATLVLSAVASVVQAAPILAEPLHRANAASTGGVVNGFINPCSTGRITDPVSVSVSCTSGGAVDSFYSLDDGSVGNGMLCFTAIASAEAISVKHAARGQAYGQLHDSLAINGPAGASGVLTAIFVIDGGVDAEVYGSAGSRSVASTSMSFQGSLSGAPSVSGVRSRFCSIVGDRDEIRDTLPDVFLLTFNLRFGRDGWAVFRIMMGPTSMSKAMPTTIGHAAPAS